MRTIPLTVLVMFLISGCASFYYTKNGYYESESTTDWKYRLEDAVCTFVSTAADHRIYVVTVSTSKHGEVYLHEYIELPSGSSYIIKDSNAIIRSSEIGVIKIPIQIDVSTPEPDVFNVPPYPVSPTYRFSKEPAIVGKIYKGITLEIPKTIWNQKVFRYVDIIAPLNIGDVERFSISLPEMQINGKTMPKYEAEFRWNSRTIHVLKKIQ